MAFKRQVSTGGPRLLQLSIKVCLGTPCKFCQNLVWTCPHVHMPTGAPDQYTKKIITYEAYTNLRGVRTEGPTHVSENV